MSLADEQIEINISKLQDLEIYENIVTNVLISNSTRYKVRIIAYNTGLCILNAFGVSYILSLPDNYEHSFKSNNIAITNNQAYLTYFNNILLPKSSLFISSKATVKMILENYFNYKHSLHDLQAKYDSFINENIPYKHVCESYNIFTAKIEFVKVKKQYNPFINICVLTS